MITTTSEAPQSTATAEQSCSTPTAGSLAPAAGTSHEGLELDGRAVPGGRPGTTETRDSGHAGDASGSVRRRAVAGSNPARPSPSHDPGHAASVCVADTTSAPGAATPSGLAPAPGSVLPAGEERRGLMWAGRASYRAMIAHTVEQLAASEYLEPGDNAYAWAWRSLVRWAELGADDATRAELDALALRLDALHVRRRGAA